MRIDASKFTDQKELFRYLSNNKAEIAEMKKSAFKYTDGISLNVLDPEAQKALTSSFNDDPLSGAIKRTVIGNTYNWMDSHGDVHLPGIFSKSIDERFTKPKSKGQIVKIFHLDNHVYSHSAKVGTPLNVYEKKVQWKDLGVNKFGYTEALFMDSEISKNRNPQIFESYLRNEVDQHSVGMQYVDLDLAMNDDEFKEAFSLWNKYINDLGNKEDAEKQGFFWIIREAKLKEISVVLEGSNSLTQTIENKLKPSADTSNDGPESSTRKDKRDKGAEKVSGSMIYF